MEVFDFYNEGLRWREKMGFFGSWGGIKIGMARSLNKKLLAVGGDDGKVKIFDWKQKQFKEEFKAHKTVCNGVIWTDWGQLCTYGWDGKLKFWKYN